MFHGKSMSIPYSSSILVLGNFPMDGGFRFVIGLPPVIIHFSGIFHLRKPSSYWVQYPMTMGVPHKSLITSFTIIHHHWTHQKPYIGGILLQETSICWESLPLTTVPGTDGQRLQRGGIPRLQLERAACRRACGAPGGPGPKPQMDDLLWMTMNLQCGAPQL